MRTAWLLAALAAFLTPTVVGAQASLRVQPLSVEVSSPSQSTSITLQNNGNEVLSLQLRVFDWSQADGEDRLTPTTEVVASPPVARIAPGSSYTVRIARTAGAAAAGAEESYRLWIDELPPAAARRSEGGQVDVRMRFDLPVFFHGRDTAPEVSWSARRSGGELVLEAVNSGTRHARIEGLELREGDDAVSFGDGLNGYVLAGSTRRWTTPAGSAAGLAGSSATVVTGVGEDETRQAVALAN
jgi:fimbrial chaperone protein